MSYVCGRSSKRIVHRNDCRYVKMIPEKNRKFFATVEEARAEGYFCCKYCSHVWKYVEKEKGALDDYCSENGLSYRFNRMDGFLDIDSRQDRWKVIVNGKKHHIFLYHRNTKISLKPESSLVSGFHSQKTISPTVLGYMKYISEHDEYVEKMTRTHKKKSKPIKGTKRYWKQVRREKKSLRRKQIRNVLEIIDRISENNYMQEVR